MKHRIAFYGKKNRIIKVSQIAANSIQEMRLGGEEVRARGPLRGPLLAGRRILLPHGVRVLSPGRRGRPFLGRELGRVQEIRGGKHFRVYSQKQ